MVRFDPRIRTSAVGTYIMTRSGIDSLMNDIWTTSAFEAFQSIFIGTGSDCVLGLRWFYGLAGKIPTIATESYVTLGNVPLRAAGKYPVSDAEFVLFNFGSIVVPEAYGDWRDLKLVEYKMLLPFVGEITLNPQDLFLKGARSGGGTFGARGHGGAKTLYLKYWVNITDGSAICQLSTTSSTTPNGTGTIFENTCQWGYDIPLKVEPIKDALTVSGGIVARVAMGVVGGATVIPGSKGTIGAGGVALGGAAGLASVPSNSTGTSYSAGSLAPNSNVMGDLTAKLIRNVHSDISGNSMQPQFEFGVGAPSNAFSTVGAFTSGFVQAAAVIAFDGAVSGIKPQHMDRVIALLQEGIYA